MFKTPSSHLIGYLYPTGFVTIKVVRLAVVPNLELMNNKDQGISGYIEKGMGQMICSLSLNQEVKIFKLRPSTADINIISQGFLTFKDYT